MQTSVTGIVIIVIILLIYALCILIKDRLHPRNLFYQRAKDRWLRGQIADSLEECDPIHMDIGSYGNSDMAGISALTAMQTAQTVSGQMAFSDGPWLITCSSGAVSYFERDAIKQGLDMVDYGNEFDPDCTIYAGFSPVSHQAGMIGILDRSSAALHLDIGAFGAETALQDLAFDTQEGICIAGENLMSQAAGILTADEVYVGEQLFELPKSLDRESEADAGLMTMDILRFALGFALVAGILIGLTG